MSANGKSDPRYQLRATRLALEALVNQEGTIISVDVVAMNPDGAPLIATRLKPTDGRYTLEELRTASDIWCLLLDGNVKPP